MFYGYRTPYLARQPLCRGDRWLFAVYLGLLDGRNIACWILLTVVVGGVGVVVRCCCCCCSYVNSHNQVRGHRTAPVILEWKDIPGKMIPGVVLLYLVPGILGFCCIWLGLVIFCWIFFILMDSVGSCCICWILLDHHTNVLTNVCTPV